MGSSKGDTILIPYHTKIPPTKSVWMKDLHKKNQNHKTHRRTSAGNLDDLGVGKDI